MDSVIENDIPSLVEVNSTGHQGKPDDTEAAGDGDEARSLWRMESVESVVGATSSSLNKHFQQDASIMEGVGGDSSDEEGYGEDVMIETMGDVLVAEQNECDSSEQDLDRQHECDTEDSDIEKTKRIEREDNYDSDYEPDIMRENPSLPTSPSLMRSTNNTISNPPEESQPSPAKPNQETSQADQQQQQQQQQRKLNAVVNPELECKKFTVKYAYYKVRMGMRFRFIQNKIVFVGVDGTNESSTALISQLRSNVNVPNKNGDRGDAEKEKEEVLQQTKATNHHAEESHVFDLETEVSSRSMSVRSAIINSSNTASATASAVGASTLANASSYEGLEEAVVIVESDSSRKISTLDEGVELDECSSQSLSNKATGSVEETDKDLSVKEHEQTESEKTIIALGTHEKVSLSMTESLFKG